MQIRGAVPQEAFAGELPQGVTCVGIPTSAGVLTAAFVDEAVAGIAPEAESASLVHEGPRAGDQPGSVPALLVPGFTGSKEDFTPFMPYLAERGRSACAYSQRGQADSAAPEGVENYRLADFVGDLIEVARAMGASERPIHLLGHSFGGVIARQAAVVAPELFRSVTLFSTGPRPPESMRWTPLRQRLLSSTTGKKLSAWYISQFLSSDPRDELIAQRAMVTSEDSLMGAALILARYPDVSLPLRQSGHPVLIAHGVGDTVWPEQMHREEAAVLGARYEVIPEAKHSAQLENPAALADVCAAFWTDVEARRN